MAVSPRQPALREAANAATPQLCREISSLCQEATSGLAAPVTETGIEDAATDILVIIKHHWDVEGAAEEGVIELIRSSLYTAVFHLALSA